MRKLIINADDLGYSSKVNAEIEDCIKKGVITSSTLMANAPAFDEGIRIAKLYPNISVGVHLNIIEFAPLTNRLIFNKYGIVDSNGDFIDGAIFAVNINEELKNAIYEEWDAQISKVERAGLIPTHIDSHQHTHTIQDLQETLIQVLHKHRIHFVRRKSMPSIRLMFCAKREKTINIYKSNAIQPVKHNIIRRRLDLFLTKLNVYLWNKSMSSQFGCTYNFYAFDDYCRHRNILHLGDNSSIIELMCHPGQPAFQSETSLLKKDMSWLPSDYELINYMQIND